MWKLYFSVLMCLAIGYEKWVSFVSSGARASSCTGVGSAIPCVYVCVPWSWLSWSSRTGANHAVFFFVEARRLLNVHLQMCCLCFCLLLFWGWREEKAMLSFMHISGTFLVPCWCIYAHDRAHLRKKLSEFGPHPVLWSISSVLGKFYAQWKYWCLCGTRDRSGWPAECRML